MGAIGPLELLIVLVGVTVTWLLTSKRFEGSKTVIRVGVAVVAFVSVIVAVTGQRTRTDAIKQVIASPDAGSLELRLQNLSAGFNQSLPMSVDSTTTLESTLVDGETFIYRYTLASDGFSLPGTAGIEASFKPILQQKACRSPEILDLLARGAVFRHRYADTGGTPVGDVFITDADCR